MHEIYEIIMSMTRQELNLSGIHFTLVWERCLIMHTFKQAVINITIDGRFSYIIAQMDLTSKFTKRSKKTYVYISTRCTRFSNNPITSFIRRFHLLSSSY